MTRILPSKWAAQMEADSRAWKAVCECGHSQSIWDLGGIRWKAKCNPRTRLHCQACGKLTWQIVKYLP